MCVRKVTLPLAAISHSLRQIAYFTSPGALLWLSTKAPGTPVLTLHIDVLKVIMF